MNQTTTPTQMTKLTLQINSLEALERLIGGDSQVEVEIRGAVAQNFTKKHLKALATCEPVQSALRATQDAILKEVAQQCAEGIATFKKTFGGSVYDVKLRSEISDAIVRQVQDVIRESVRTAVDEGVKKSTSETAIDRKVSERFEYYTTDMINSQIKNRLDALKAKL